jgi:hypothetical protein
MQTCWDWCKTGGASACRVFSLVFLFLDVKVAHMRLCHSRMMFFRAYPRETQERVFDAHEQAFAFFRGARTRGIHDNLWTPPAAR